MDSNWFPENFPDAKVGGQFVYRILCIPNGKSYIGRSKSPKWRIHSHYSALKNGYHSSKELQKDFDTFGTNAFAFSILGEEKFVPNTEKEMQALYKSYLPEFGYNTKDQNWYAHNRKEQNERINNSSKRRSGLHFT